MNAVDAMTLLSALGCSHIKVNLSNTWVASTCPLAIWTHKGGIDKHPSFGVSIHADVEANGDVKGESKFKCYTCNVGGSLVGEMGLLRRIKLKSKVDLKKIEGINPYVWTDMRNEMSKAQLDAKSKSTTNVSGWKYDPFKPIPNPTGLGLTADTTAKLEEAPPPLPESELARFTDPSPELMSYLHGERRLTDATIKQWELKWHEGARRIAIPIRDALGNLVGVSGRAFDGQRPKFLHSKGFRRDFYLYGEQTCRRNEPGYLTEGFFDVMFLQQNGINAFAIMGSYLSRVQVEKCLSMFTRIVMVPDGDEPGEEAATRIKERLGAQMSVIISPMAAGKDPDELTADELDAVRRL